jgi:hypothetical protein
VSDKIDITMGPEEKVDKECKPSRGVTGTYVLHSLPKAIVTNIPSFFLLLSIFKPVDAFMDKTAQNLHQDEIRDSGISLNSDPSLIPQEPAEKIKGRESGW